MSEYEPLGISKEIAGSWPEVPEDLKDIFIDMAKIKRFKVNYYPEGIFIDDDKTHTLRLVAMIRSDYIKGIDKPRAERMAFIHDTPETVTGDVVAPEKEKPGIDIKVEKQEDEVAEKILSASDFKLYREYVNSGNFLKGKHDRKEDISKEGLVAYIVDKIDGNMFFHFYLAKWFGKQGDEPKNASEASLVYCFNQAIKFKSNLAKLEDKFPEAVATCRLLLDEQLKFIIDCWNNVDENLRPEVINSELSSLLKAS